MNEKTRTLLGFCSKANRLVSGENTCKARTREIKLVIVSTDCRQEVQDRYQHHFPDACYQLASRYELGLAIGKSPRTVIGITDASFAKSIEKSINSKHGGSSNE